MIMQVGVVLQGRMNGLCRVPVLELATQMCACPSQFQEERGNVLMGASVHSNYESFVYQAKSAASIYCLGRPTYMWQYVSCRNPGIQLL